jgi:hypothetical protein
VGGAPVKRRTVFARGAGARAAVAVSSAVVIVIAVVNELTNTT